MLIIGEGSLIMPSSDQEGLNMDKTKRKHGTAILIAFAIFLSLLNVTTIVLARGGGFSSPFSIALFVLAAVSALLIYLTLFLAWTRGNYLIAEKKSSFSHQKGWAWRRDAF